MNANQSKITDSAIERMNEIRSMIATNQGDVEKLTKEYNNIVGEVKAKLDDVLSPLRKSNEKFWERHNKINIRSMPVCGTLERQPDFTPAEAIVANAAADVIREAVKADPINYADLQEMTKDISSGRGAGDSAYEVVPVRIGAPSWVKEIVTDLRHFKGRSKTKEDYDLESMVRGTFRKQKAKKNIRKKTLFLCIDTSGSMMYSSTNGHSVIELVAGYILPIANQFMGELWEIDDEVPQNKKNLKDVKKQYLMDMKMSLRGGGGTNFDEAFRQLNDKREEFRKLHGDKIDFMTVFLTDAAADWNQKLMPDNLLIVTVPMGVSYLPKLDASRNQKAIVIDVDEK